MNPAIGHDRDCLAAGLREAHCSCARRDWLLESVPRWQARAEAYEQISRWTAEKAKLAIGRAHDSMEDRPVFEAEAHRAAARMAEVLYVEFGNTARMYLKECRKVEPAKPAEQLAVVEPAQQSVVDVELPLFAVPSPGDQTNPTTQQPEGNQ